jgi:hypothetical protein
MAEVQMEVGGVEAVKTALNRIPLITNIKSTRQPKSKGWARLDALITLGLGKSEWQLPMVIRSNAKPQQVRDAIAHLRQYPALSGAGVYPVVVAPWFSPQSRAICQEAGVGFVDLAGNCRLSFDKIYVERTGFAAPKAQKREFKSLFGSKSARALRMLLREPQRPWRLTELSENAHISLGQASNLRRALLDLEWAKEGSNGFYLSQPQQLLEAWAKTYKPPKRTRQRFYTLHHGKALAQAVHRAIQEAHPDHKLILASSSAARWWAPFARSATEYFYADASGLKLLRQHLQLEAVSSGENVVVDLTEDEGVFLDRREVGGLWATSPVQTFLDLTLSGERAEAAAQHLLKTKILPNWGCS